MTIQLRKFIMEDIPYKIQWINDPINNQYLHYELPLLEDKTAEWYERIKKLDTRLDMTILSNNIPVGIVGLLNIDSVNGSAELYITVGDSSCKGQGVAGQAMRLLMEIGFFTLGLERIFLLTETGNTAAIRAYDKFGFVREGCLRNDIRNRQRQLVDRYVYSMLKNEFEDRYGTN